MKRKIRVLIVDDSAVVQQTMTEIINSENDLEVMAAAADPFIAAEKMLQEAPDVITLDVEMPRMDGISFLQKIMTQHPIPVVMCSSLSQNGSETALRALELGAVEIISKPRIDTKTFLHESRIRICDAIRAASISKPRRLVKPPIVERKLTADAMIPKPTSKAMIQTTEKVAVVGASTGGTEAIQVLLTSLPADAPGVVIVQHMPEHFTTSFARRLDQLCAVSVKEAEDNDTVIPGRVLIAPGNLHTLIKRSGARYFVEVKDGPLVARHRPSVDVLFRSAARYCGKNAVAALMTGMGDDGAQGLLELREAGAYTIAQDEASCVVFGMPNEAIKRGAACTVAPLQDIAGLIMVKANL